MGLRGKIKNFKSTLGDVSRTRRGRNALLYLLFVAVAFVFWLVMSMDDEVQRDFDIPVELQDVPDSIVVINDLPPTLAVSVRAKGNLLVPFLWRQHLPALKLKFGQYARSKSEMIYLNRYTMERCLREYFGDGVNISSCRPDTICLLYTDSPGRRLPIHIKVDLHANRQYVINGPVRADVDSVTVYAHGRLPRNLRSLDTETVMLSDLRDTTVCRVKVKVPAGVRAIPDEVTLTIPVEPLIVRKRHIPVEILNVPSDKSVVMFPSKAEVSYLVPMSAYNEDFHLVAYANYADIVPGRTRLPLSLSLTSELISNISLQPDSVEYIIQAK